MGLILGHLPLNLSLPRQMHQNQPDCAAEID